MDSYVEQIVAHKKTGKDLIISIIMILSVLGIVAIGFLFGILINFYFVIVGFFLAAFDIYFCWYVITGRNVEYEYTVTNNNLQIDKIMAKRRRKEILSIDINRIEGMDTVEENRLSDAKCNKVMHLGTDISDTSQHRFIVLTNKYGRIMVIFAPNEKIMTSLKMYLKPEVKIEMLKSRKK